MLILCILRIFFYNGAGVEPSEGRIAPQCIRGTSIPLEVWNCVRKKLKIEHVAVPSQDAAALCKTTRRDMKSHE